MNYYKNTGENASYKKATFTINKETIKEFDEFCKNNSINKSKWVEFQMNKFLEEAKKN